MADKKTDGHDESSKTAEVEPIIFKSPLHKMFANVKIPEITVTDMVFEALDMNYESLKDRDWVVDVIKGTSYKFSDIKPLSAKFASVLTRKGFKKGDVLYFVTYDVALIYILKFGVWRCGGAVRGCFQREEKEEFLRQMKETSARFVLCDPDTAPPVKWAVQQMDWPVQLFSIGGEVEGATAVEQMIEEDDGSALPHDLKINPKEVVFSIPNTSGSTGFPKGAMHTHYNVVALGTSMGVLKAAAGGNLMGMSLLTLMGNFAVGTISNICLSIAYNFTIYSISKFEQQTFMKHVQKYKPDTIFVYPYVANWFARAPELDTYDFSFINRIASVGSVFDVTTAKLLTAKLPQLKLMQTFGMSECLIISTSNLGLLSLVSDEDESVGGLKLLRLDEEVHVSSGVLLPFAEAKIMDPNTGCTVGPKVKGNLLVRCPYIMKGYMSSNDMKGSVSEVDEGGWLDTGDIAFLDEASHLYVVERKTFIFKYYMHQVSPSEIETVIGEHPAVLSVGVVGMPDLLTTSAARAYVVLKPGHQATEEEIKQYVAERKIFYKHLHGGVEFVDSLPESRGGKLDRSALLQRAIEKSKSKVESLT